MKVTSNLPDELIEEVRRYAGAKTLTDCLEKALSEWTALQRVHRLNQAVRERPLVFADGFDSENVRELNRKR